MDFGKYTSELPLNPMKLRTLFLPCLCGTRVVMDLQSEGSWFTKYILKKKKEENTYGSTMSYSLVLCDHEADLKDVGQRFDYFCQS